MTVDIEKSDACLSSPLWQADGNIETYSTIIQRVPGSNFFTTDALTDNGWLRFLSTEYEEDVREQLTSQMSHAKAWVSNSTTYIIPKTSKPAEPQPPVWMHDHNEILLRLESPDTNSSDFEKAILIAEITDFADQKTGRLLRGLGAYISNHRFATDEDTLVLLGCAIRKYALNMPPEAMEQYADWLSMGEADAIHNRVELELVKGILWRLSYEPFPNSGTYPTTVATLQEITDSYLNRRLIFQKSNVSIATLAVTALFVLHTISANEDSIPELMRKVKNLNRNWIGELVEDNIAEAVDAISEYDTGLNQKLAACFRDAKANLF